MSDDLQLRLAQFEARIAQLEIAVLERKLYPIPYPQPAFSPPPTGCVCPLGVEASCRNGLCPRRGAYATMATG